MFKYVGDISKISHYIIDKFLENKNIAIDATLGNGYDTDFLSKNSLRYIHLKYKKKHVKTILKEKMKMSL